MSPYRAYNSNSSSTLKLKATWTPELGRDAYLRGYSNYNPIYKVGDILIANNSDAKMMITEIKGAYYMFSILGTAKTGSAHIEDFDLNTSVFLVA